MAAFCQRIAHASWFKHGITSLILFAGVLVGCETYPRIVDQWGRELALLNDIILRIFVIDRGGAVAEGSRPWRLLQRLECLRFCDRAQPSCPGCIADAPPASVSRV